MNKVLDSLDCLVFKFHFVLSQFSIQYYLLSVLIFLLYLFLFDLVRSSYEFMCWRTIKQ